MFAPENVKAAGGHEKMYFVCEVFKNKNGAFAQAFEKTNLVGDLKETIKEAQGCTCCTNQLKLWFTTTTNDAGKAIWLPDGDTAKQLGKGEIHPHIRALAHKSPLEPSRTIALLMEKISLRSS